MIEVDWTIFQTKYLPKKEVFVVEYDDRWELFTAHEIWKIKTVVEKYADQSENIMFLERYLHNRPNIIKVLSIGEDTFEQFPEEIFEEPEEELHVV